MVVLQYILQPEQLQVKIETTIHPIGAFGSSPRIVQLWIILGTLLILTSYMDIYGMYQLYFYETMNVVRICRDFSLRLQWAC